MNVSALSGNLVATPELKVTPSNVPVCSFTIAVKRPKTKDKTDFIDCVAWRQTAEFITRNFQKGSAIEVSGPITSRMYEDKNGKKRKAVEIVVDSVSFSGHKKPDETAVSSTEPNYSNVPVEDFREIPEDDLPF